MLDKISHLVISSGGCRTVMRLESNNRNSRLAFGEHVHASLRLGEILNLQMLSVFFFFCLFFFLVQALTQAVFVCLAEICLMNPRRQTDRTRHAMFREAPKGQGSTQGRSTVYSLGAVGCSVGSPWIRIVSPVHTMDAQLDWGVWMSSELNLSTTLRVFPHYARLILYRSQERLLPPCLLPHCPAITLGFFVHHSRAHLHMYSHRFLGFSEPPLSTRQDENKEVDFHAMTNIIDISGKNVTSKTLVWLPTLLPMAA